MNSFILRAHVLLCSCCSSFDHMGSWGDSEFSCPECYQTVSGDQVTLSDFQLDTFVLRRSIFEGDNAVKSKRRIMKYLTFLGRPDTEVYDRDKVEAYYHDLTRPSELQTPYKLFQIERL